MLINKRTFLLRMTLGAGSVHALKIGAGASHRIASMHIMAIATGHLATEHIMAVRQAKLGAFVQVALEARFRLLARINDRALAAPSSDVETAWAMTGFAAGVADL